MAGNEWPPAGTWAGDMLYLAYSTLMNAREFVDCSPIERERYQKMLRNQIERFLVAYELKQKEGSK